MFYFIFIMVTVIDQLSKFWIRMHLKVGESFGLWNGPVIITHYENSGAAFSSFQGYGRFFVPVAILIILIIILYRNRENNKRILLELGTGFLAGGAAGNAIDRTLFNQVTDFITFHNGHGILNISDFAINVGIIFLLFDTVVSLLEDRKKRYSGNI